MKKYEVIRSLRTVLGELDEIRYHVTNKKKAFNDVVYRIIDLIDKVKDLPEEAFDE